MSDYWTVISGLLCIIGLYLGYINFFQAILYFIGLTFVLPLIIIGIFILGVIILEVIFE